MNNTIPTLFIILGIFFLLLGLLWNTAGKYFQLGNLPGDIKIEKENFKLYFPLGTSIAVSIILTILLWLFYLLRK